jgi:16S rRNA processing protein RimM
MLKKLQANLKKENCVRIGTFIKVHGIKGELVLRLDIEFDLIEEMESIFVEIDKLLVPFFISDDIKILNNNTIAFKIDDIDPGEQSKSILNCDVYLPKKNLSAKKTDFQLDELIGYSIVDKEYGILGILTNVYNIPNNPLIQVINKDLEILLPLKSLQLLKKNAEKKILSIVAPKELIDYYLNPES